MIPWSFAYYLVRFCDVVLRQDISGSGLLDDPLLSGESPAGVVHRVLMEAVDVFSFLADKDSFAELYRLQVLASVSGFQCFDLYLLVFGRGCVSLCSSVFDCVNV